MFKTVLVPLLTVAAATMTTLVAAEALLRSLHLAPATGVFTVTDSEFGRIPGIFSPNQQLLDRMNSRLPHSVTIDSLGLRGTDFPRAKPPGELRILFIGDSFVYGSFVNDDQTMPSQLERALRTRCPTARVINAGLGGSTITDQRQVVLRTLPLEPDMVLLTFSENDIADLHRSPPLWTELANNREQKSVFPMSWMYPILRETALWNLALKARGTLRARQIQSLMAEEQAVRRDSLSDVTREWYRNAFVDTKELLTERHIPHLLVLFPSHHTVTTRQSSDALKWAEHMGQGENTRVVNLLAPFVQAQLPDTVLYLLPWDGHPSLRAYEIAGRVLANEVLTNEKMRSLCEAGGELVLPVGRWSNKGSDQGPAHQMRSIPAQGGSR